MKGKRGKVIKEKGNEIMKLNIKCHSGTDVINKVRNASIQNGMTGKCSTEREREREKERVREREKERVRERERESEREREKRSGRKIKIDPNTFPHPGNFYKNFFFFRMVYLSLDFSTLSPISPSLSLSRFFHSFSF